MAIFVLMYSATNSYQNLQRPGRPQEDAHRGEAVRLPVGGLRLEVCQEGAADGAPAQAHRGEAVQVPRLWRGLLADRDP